MNGGAHRQFDLPAEALAEIEERRSKIRYPLKLEVRFFTSEGSSHAQNIGQTLNISSSGLLISSSSVTPEGAVLRVMIQWPSALDGRIPLQLVATGVVVRSNLATFAVAVSSYQFRTMKQQARLHEVLTAHA